MPLRWRYTCYFEQGVSVALAVVHLVMIRTRLGGKLSKAVYSAVGNKEVTVVR